MNVIDKIENNMTLAPGELQQLLHLAKLGQAALDATINDDVICDTLMPVNDKSCKGCNWITFCKLRKEQTP